MCQSMYRCDCSTKHHSFRPILPAYAPDGLHEPLHYFFFLSRYTDRLTVLCARVCAYVAASLLAYARTRQSGARRHLSETYPDRQNVTSRADIKTTPDCTLGPYEYKHIVHDSDWSKALIASVRASADGFGERTSTRSLRVSLRNIEVVGPIAAMHVELFAEPFSGSEKC